MHFTLNGEHFEITPEDVKASLAGEAPQRIYEHAVEVNGVRYPVKQAFAVATGRDGSEFTSHRARDVLRRLGFTDSRPAVGAARAAQDAAGPQETAGPQPRPEPGSWILELRTAAGGRQQFQLAADQNLGDLEAELAYRVGGDTTYQVAAVHPDASGGRAVFAISWRNVSAATLYQQPAADE